MDAFEIILTLLVAFNLSRMVIKAYGDKFPHPFARRAHAEWLQSWRNTQNPKKRYWIQIAITFAVVVLFNVAGDIALGFLIFLRIILFILGYKRAMVQIAQMVTSQSPAATASQPMVQAELPQGYAPAVASSITPQARVSAATVSQAPPPPSGKSAISKGGWALLIVTVLCVAAGLLDHLYNRSHTSNDNANSYYAGSPADNSPAGSGTTSALSGALGDSSDKTYGTGSPATNEPTSQAAQMQQPVQAPSQQVMQQAVHLDTSAQTQVGNAGVTVNTYGNEVASFYPGKSPLDAISDALVSIHSELTVLDMAPSGYPEYQIECESNGQCVGGTGTPMGPVVDVAKEMLPVNPSDIGRGGITCGQYICNDGNGNVIGRVPAHMQ